MSLPDLPNSTTDSFIPSRSRTLVQEDKSTARWLQIILDQILVIGLLFAHTWLKGIPFDTDYRILAVVTMLLMTVIYQSNSVYKFTLSLSARYLNLAKSWIIVLALIVLIAFVTKTSATYSREVILTWSLTGYVAQCLAYFFVNALQIRAKGEIIPTLLIGAGELGRHLTTNINDNKWIPDQIVGVIEDSESLKDNWLIADAPILGTLSDLYQTIKTHHIKRVYIALPMQRSEMMKSIYLNLANKNIDVIWAPDIFGVNLLNHSIREVAGVPLISLSETPLIGSSAFIKTVMDFTIATTALVLTSPLMILTAMLIKLSSPGPILFSQKRHGWDGEIITIYKFRSMRLHEEEDGMITQASISDDRVTWIGSIIRRTSIDELPQLLNVINGTMSIVGPRPHPIVLNEYYENRISSYLSRHRVKPGLTGLAQVNGFRGETQSLEIMVGRVEYDLAYINNWSPWLDIQIMFRTIFVLFGKGVY